MATISHTTTYTSVGSDAEEVRWFILWDPRDGDPIRDNNGDFVSNGLLGRIDLDNVYLTVYPVFPEGKHPQNLEVGQCIKGVIYRQCMSRGDYDVYRVK